MGHLFEDNNGIILKAIIIVFYVEYLHQEELDIVVII